MSLALVLGATWVAVAAPVALAVGRAVRLADRHEIEGSSLVPDFLPANWTQQAELR